MTLALLVVQSLQAKVRQWCLSVLPSNTTSQREIGIAILVERPERDPNRKAVINSIWALNCTGFWIVCCCNWDCSKEGQGYQAHVHWQAVLHVQRLTVNGIIKNICEQHVVQQATYMLVIMQVLWCSNIHIFTRLKADTTVCCYWLISIWQDHVQLLRPATVTEWTSLPGWRPWCSMMGHHLTRDSILSKSNAQPRLCVTALTAYLFDSIRICSSSLICTSQQSPTACLNDRVKTHRLTVLCSTPVIQCIVMQHEHHSRNDCEYSCGLQDMNMRLIRLTYWQF